MTLTTSDYLGYPRDTEKSGLLLQNLPCFDRKTPPWSPCRAEITTMESPRANHFKSLTPWPIWILEMWKNHWDDAENHWTSPYFETHKKKTVPTNIFHTKSHGFLKTSPSFFKPFGVAVNRPLFGGEHDAAVNKWTSCPRWPISGYSLYPAW